MANTMMWITHSTISAGSKVDINASNVVLDFKVFNPHDQVPGKDMSTSWDTKLPEVDFCGFDVPLYSVNGHFISGVSTNSSGSVLLNLGMLASYCTLGSPVFVHTPNVDLNSAGSMAVILGGFKVTEQVDAENSILPYILTFKETKTW